MINAPKFTIGNKFYFKLLIVMKLVLQKDVKAKHGLLIKDGGVICLDFQMVEDWRELYFKHCLLL